MPRGRASRYFQRRDRHNHGDRRSHHSSNGDGDRDVEFEDNGVETAPLPGPSYHPSERGGGLLRDSSGLSSHEDREREELLLMCDAASESDPTSWDKIRRWLRNHTADDARAAAEIRGDYETTALHVACRNRPPLDVANMLLAAGPETVGWADGFGWLPLHYACANGASGEVLALLVERHPASKTATDKRKLTPLHFLLGNTERPADAVAVALLSGTGATIMADEKGMLPLHYACAYGLAEPALRVLTDENLQTITATDNRGRTPLHFAMGNAARPASPAVVGLLLSRNPAVVDTVDLEGNLPIHLLARQAQAIKEDEKEKCAACRECFGLYLDGRPRSSADLLTALQSLPDWLRDSAVLSPVVQKILNVKISQRFPTAVMLLDFAFIALVIVSFQFAVLQGIDHRQDMADGVPDPTEVSEGWLASLYVAGIYFYVRETFNAISLASLGLFGTWIRDAANWLDLLYIFLIFFWAVVMSVNALHDLEGFRTGAVLSMMFYWFMLLNFIQSVSVGFAVFTGGVKYVLRRLSVYLMVLIIILLMFAQIFLTMFQTPDQCNQSALMDSYIEFPVTEFNCTNDGAEVVYDETPTTYNGCLEQVESCEPDVENPFCNFWLSFMKVITMLLGEVDEGLFRGNTFASLFFSLFMFICVIVLANVLIAIVTDSYSFIQNERAALVFWSNRLDFVAEMDVISNNFSRRGRGGARGVFDADVGAMGDLWKKLVYIFDDEIVDQGFMSGKFVIYVLRILVGVVVIPLWLVVGLCSFGLLWPPQVREKLLTSQVTSGAEKSNTERNRLSQVNALKEDIFSFEEELKSNMEKGRDELCIFKAALDATKAEMHTEISDMKEIVTDLFELLGSTEGNVSMGVKHEKG